MNAFVENKLNMDKIYIIIYSIELNFFIHLHSQ